MEWRGERSFFFGLAGWVGGWNGRKEVGFYGMDKVR